jgi:hypothetical protein
MRVRVIEAVEAGAARREAAKRFNLNASSGGAVAATVERNAKRPSKADRGRYLALGATCGPVVGHS